jgi:hypothetical protein
LHIDRAACACLIRRDLEPEATFVFVDDPTEVLADATAFDLRSVERGPSRRAVQLRGDPARCQLDDPVVWKLAELVHEADPDDERFDARKRAGWMWCYVACRWCATTAGAGAVRAAVRQPRQPGRRTGWACATAHHGREQTDPVALPADGRLWMCTRLLSNLQLAAAPLARPCRSRPAAVGPYLPEIDVPQADVMAWSHRPSRPPRRPRPTPSVTVTAAVVVWIVGGSPVIVAAESVGSPAPLRFERRDGAAFRALCVGGSAQLQVECGVGLELRGSRDRASLRRFA